MAMTPYSGDTSVIGDLGTTPQERGLTTQQFKDKFDEGLKAFVEWFNLTHKTEFEAVQTDLATHKADSAAHGVSHKNLLHNWDFRNPVNQRGFTSTTSAGDTIDRWRLTASGHTVEVVSDGIKLIASKNAGLNNCFVQLVENYSSFVGVTLTLSAHIVENTLTQGCNLRWNDNASPVITGTGYFSHTFTPSSLSYLQIGVQFANRDVDDGKYVIIDKMKLEIGTVSTLANDPPADYREQLVLCKSFLRNIILSPDEADAELMGNGDIWIQYEAGED
jgi:hypothetical protein